MSWNDGTHAKVKKVNDAPVPEKMGPKGGKGGTAWDDGSDHDGVTQISVNTTGAGISFVQFSYMKGGQTKDGACHGRYYKGSTTEFRINHPEEYLLSIEGLYDSTNTIQVIQFKTNQKTSPYIGYKSNGIGTEFTLHVQKKKIIGFFGCSSDNLNSIGAYFVPSGSEPEKVGPERGEGGTVWDEGFDHDDVTEITAGFGGARIHYVQFDYVKGGQTKHGALHGENGIVSKITKFGIDHTKNEYLLSVEGWYDSSEIIRGIQFRTNKKASEYVGYKSDGTGTKFTLQVQDKKIIGFFGFANTYLNSIGAYFVPSSSTPTKKLEAKGGDTGAVWDDGPHDNVKKVYVLHRYDGVVALKFEYTNGSQVVHGNEHGNMTLLGVEEEFEVDADDYIVYVEGYRAKVSGVPEKLIMTLKFKTFKGKTSKQFGTFSGTKFVLQGGKIVGFHGRSTDVLHSLGAYVSFPSTPLGKWIEVVQKGEAPGPRCSHAIAQVGNKIYSFGGEFIPNQPIDKHLYVFDLETRTWSIVPATGDVPHLSCLGVRMVSIGSSLYVFGGRDASRQYNGFYSFDTTKNEWKLLTPLEEGPTPRSFHSMAADEKNVYVFGGVSARPRLKTLDAYNVVDQKWVQCSTPGDSLSIRGGAGLEVVQGKVWVVYGFNGSELDDVHYYDPVEEYKWTQVETFGEKPSARSVFASAVVGKHIVIFGGEMDMDPLFHVGPGQMMDDTFALDTETLKWERLDHLGEEEGCPSIRGWTASTSGTIDGKKGLVMLGGKAQSNGRFGDLFFYGINDSA